MSSLLCLAASTIWGLTRVLANEMPQLKCSTIDLGFGTAAQEGDSLFREILANSDEREVVLRGADRYVPRLVPGTLPSEQAHHDSYRVAVTTRGSLESVTTLPASRASVGAGQVEIEVVAAAVNFKDVAKALNLLDDETLANTWSGHTLGLECAGRITSIGAGVDRFQVGDRVIALAADCFRPHVTTQAEFVCKLPEGLSLEAAAGLPVVFLTAGYALHQLARIQPGERVLIHAAAGGVGLAAIQMAQLAGAEVFATAGSPLKRDYLRTLGVQQVFDSRSLSFVDDIQRVTKDQGIDVVLNSLAGAAIPASLSLLRAGGRFVEIGKRDIQSNESLRLRPFHDNLSFFALDLDRLLAQRPDKARLMLELVMQQFTTGQLVPIPYRTFPVSRAAEALKYVAKARQIGKVVLEMRRESEAPAEPRASDLQKVTRNHRARLGGSLDLPGTAVVTGGLTGFGLETAKWLVKQGVKHLALLSRSGASSLEAQQEILELEEAGAKVLALSVDVSDEQQLSAALETIRRTLPPLTGVYHAAMVLDDAIAVQLTPERMEKVLAPKAWGAWNLHKLTLNDPVEQFVLYSSATTVFGNPSQANYVAACTFLDQLAQHRHSLGRPALSVAWGAIADVGYLSRNADVLKHIEDRLGFKPLPSEMLLSSLGRLLSSGRTQAALVAINWSRFSPAKFAIASAPRMAGLVAQFGSDTAGAISGAGRFRETLAEAPPEERRGLLRGFLAKSLAGVLGTAPENVPTDRSLLALGLDSLMAVELQMGVGRELEYDISPMQLLRGPTLEELTDEILAAFANDPNANATPSPATSLNGGQPVREKSISRNDVNGSAHQPRDSELPPSRMNGVPGFSSSQAEGEKSNSRLQEAQTP